MLKNITQTFHSPATGAPYALYPVLVKDEAGVPVRLYAATGSLLDPLGNASTDAAGRVSVWVNSEVHPLLTLLDPTSHQPLSATIDPTLDATYLGLVELYARAVSRSGKDGNGIYTIVEERRADQSLISRSVLSGGTSPAYTTRTETIYGVDGTTVLATLVFALTYDSGDLVSEVLS